MQHSESVSHTATKKPSERLRDALHDMGTHSGNLLEIIAEHLSTAQAEEVLRLTPRSTPAPLSDAQIAAIGGEPRNVLDVMGSDPAPRTMRLPSAPPAVSSTAPRTKAQCLAAVIKELNLDTTDPFTRVLAAAFALQDAYDENRAALARCQEEVHRLLAPSATGTSKP